MLFPTKNPLARALYLNAGVLVLILLVLLGRSPTPSLLPAALGQTQSPIAGGGGVYVMPAQFHSQVWGCFLLDVDKQTLCTYEYDAGQRQLRLTSARNFQYDRMLKNFATTPAPWEVRQMVEQEMTDEHSRAAAPPVEVNPAPSNPVQSPH